MSGLSPERKRKNLERMRFMRTFDTYQDYQRAILFKKFSLLVDAIDLYRSQLPDEDRVRSQKLDQKYRDADAMILRLRRLGFR